MYCSNCGEKGSGNFCAGCGHKLHKPEQQLAVRSDEPLEPIFDADELTAGGGWEHEVNYKALIRHPDVRDLLEMAGNRAQAGMTGEEFLKKFESVVPGATIAAAFVQPLSQWGVNTGKSTAQSFPQPAGRVIVSILCALAEGSSKIRNVHQIPNGCRIEASIPSDIWSFEGVLFIQVERQSAGTLVQAATKIPGQFFDLGKSQRVLDHLLGCVRNAA
ncbi:MAG: hypothetical protein JNG89_06705 [Planctomycetaceae bacterium]|nr:hypothetical protein [Planctomycetaceae bacterium]